MQGAVTTDLRFEEFLGGIGLVKSGANKSPRSEGRIYVGPVWRNNYRGGGCCAGGSCKLREIVEITLTSHTKSGTHSHHHSVFSLYEVEIFPVVVVVMKINLVSSLSIHLLLNFLFS